MYRPLFFLSLGAATMVVLAFATVHEFTRFRPEVELRRAFVALAQAETVRQVSGFGWTEGTGDGRLVSTVYTSGQVRASDASFGARFRLVRLGKAQYNDIAGELRSVDGTNYLTYEPPGPEVSGSPFATADSWLSFTPEELHSWGPLFPGVPLPIDSLFDDTAAPWTPATILAARRLFAQADFSYVSFDGAFETVNDHKTRILDARPDRQATEGFLLGLVRVREGRDPVEAERVRASLLAAGLSRLTFRVWVGVTDHLPYRVQTAGLWTQENGTHLPVDFLVEFSALNDPFAVVAPTASPSRSVLGSWFGALPSAGVRAGGRPLASLSPSASLPSVSFGSADDTDGDGLDAVLETFYGTNQRVADTDGDGFTDGEEVRRGWNPRGTGSLFGFGLGR